MYICTHITLLCVIQAPGQFDTLIYVACMEQMNFAPFLDRSAPLFTDPTATKSKPRRLHKVSCKSLQ